jgi:hypothetical protein
VRSARRVRRDEVVDEADLRTAPEHRRDVERGVAVDLLQRDLFELVDDDPHVVIDDSLHARDDDVFAPQTPPASLVEHTVRLADA